MRESAAKALGKLGEHAKDAVPALIKSLKDSDSGVRRSAAQALENLGENEGRASIEPPMKIAKLN